VEPPPTVDEIGAMLRHYFVSSTEQDVTRLHTEVAATLSDPASAAAEARGFDPVNGRRGFGLAWREDLAYKHRRPTPIDLAAWIAFTQPGYPSPRPYCPDVFVGTWTQRWPKFSPAATWELRLDGTLVCGEPTLTTYTMWCVNRQGPALLDSVIWFDDDTRIAHYYLMVNEVTPRELIVHEPGTPTKYELVR
jgi:hypothetical protein